MTKLLQQAFEEAERLLSTEEQDALAYALISLVEDEQKWDAAFADPKSHSLLEKLAAEALEEERAGKTTKLNPDAL